MSDVLKVRIRAPSGENQVQELERGTALGLLRYLLEGTTNVPADEMVLLVGFPPKPIDAPDETPLEALVQNGDQIIVQKGQAVVKQGHTDGKYIPPSSTLGSFVRRKMPGDNSCLFHTAAYVLENKSRSEGKNMRGKIAEVVAAHPQKYTAAWLGRPNIEYCMWIQDKDSWGGAIELSILSFLYQSEIIALDISAGGSRLDRYGEGEGYSTVCYVCYTGEHYDAMAMARYGGAPDGEDQVMFNVRDDNVLQRARQFVAEEKKKQEGVRGRGGSGGPATLH